MDNLWAQLRPGIVINDDSPGILALRRVDLISGTFPIYVHRGLIPIQNIRWVWSSTCHLRLAYRWLPDLWE
jgi:hypothetical protein